MKKYLSLMLIFYMSLTCLASKTVQVTGSAAGTPDKAGELALTDALRSAVREGAGVDLISESKVTNFQTEYDRVLTSSFGYVEDYQILEQGYDEKSGIYTVKLEAIVGKKTPGMDKVLGLRLLVKRMGSPRVTIECKEKIRGIDDHDYAFSSSVVEEMAQRNGFELFNQNAINDQNSRESLRAELLGDTLDSKVKKAGITSTSDFKILTNVSGSVGREKEPFPDVYVRDVALGVDMRAVWTDTGEVIATVSIPTKRFKGEANMNLPFDMPDQLVRFYLSRVLQGKEPGSGNDSGYKLFRRIIAKWIVELDLGAKIKLEFKRIDKKTLDSLIAKLKGTKGISYVWRREFDKRLFSIVEVESRLTSTQLEDVVLKSLNNKYEVDQATKKSLRFIPVNK